MIRIFKDVVHGNDPARLPRSPAESMEVDLLIRNRKGLSMGTGSVGGVRVIVLGTRPGELVRVRILGRQIGGMPAGRLLARLRSASDEDTEKVWDRRQIERLGLPEVSFQNLKGSGPVSGLFRVRISFNPENSALRSGCLRSGWASHDPLGCDCLAPADMRLLNDWFRLIVEFDPFRQGLVKAELFGSRTTGECLLSIPPDKTNLWAPRAARILRGQHLRLAGVISSDGRLVDGKTSLIHRERGSYCEMGASELKHSGGQALAAALRAGFPGSGRPVLVWSEHFEPAVLELARRVRFVYWAGLTVEQGKKTLENALRNGVHGLRIVSPQGGGPLTLPAILQADIPWEGLLLMLPERGLERVPAELLSRKWTRRIIAGTWDARFPGFLRGFENLAQSRVRIWVSPSPAGRSAAATVLSKAVLRKEGLRKTGLLGASLAAGLVLGTLVFPQERLSVLPVQEAGVERASDIQINPQRLARYDFLEVTAASPPGFRADSAELEVYFAGERQVSLGGLDPWKLREGEVGQFRTRWPLPFNPKLGEYRVRVAFHGRDGKVEVSPEKVFLVEGRPQPETQPGQSAMTMEILNSETLTQLQGPAGEEPGPHNVASWARYIGCDMVWQCAGVTSAWRTPKNRVAWEPALMRSISRIGPGLKAAGLGHGAWLQAFAVLGGVPDLGIYQVAYRYAAESDSVVPTRHISYKDEGRIQEIAGMIRRLDALPTLDAIGLDYVRLGFGGYELVEEFMNDMDLEKPNGWGSWGQESKMKWLASHVEVERDRPVLVRWNWWRAHKTALVVKRILEEAAPRKPVWVFTLGWRQGLEHGQDPMMLIDAGISFTAVMLYEADRASFESMKKDWLEYLRRGAPAMMVGQIVDWDLMQKTEDPSGPMEMRNRLLEPLDAWWPANPRVGFFWHDLTRALTGRLGPYPTKEWVVAGASAFTRLREKNGMTPLLGRWLEAPAGEGSFALLNAGGLPLYDVELRRLDTDNLGTEFVDGLVVGKLEAGEEKSFDQWAIHAAEGPGPLALAVTYRVGASSQALRRETYLMYFQGLPPQIARRPDSLDKGGVGGYP